MKVKRTRIKSLLLSILLMCVLTTLSHTQTYVAGDVYGVWDSTGSPYLVIGELRVPSDSSLYIMPGCSVIFQGHYSLSVDTNARFKALGTEYDSIVFTAVDTNLTDSSGGHHGIRFYSTADGCTLAYCRIEYGNGIGVDSDEEGGAIYCQRAHISLLHNTITRNVAVDGAGIYCEKAGLYSYGNRFDMNSADYDDGDGGGVSCKKCSLKIVESIFADNSAERGAAIFAWKSKVEISDNDIYNNSCKEGVLHCYSTCEGDIIGNWIVTNDGRGIETYNSELNIMSNRIAYNSGSGLHTKFGDLYIVNNVIDGNRAGRGAGITSAYSQGLIINNTIINNIAASDGGGIYFYGDDTPLFVNNILWSDSASRGAEIYVAYRFCPHCHASCTLSMSYNAVDTSACFAEGGSAIIWGDGNINHPPLFIDSSCQLSDSSPCIDAGTGSIYVSAWDAMGYAPGDDYRGTPRPLGADVDIGACEYINHAEVTIINTGLNLISLQRVSASNELNYIFPAVRTPAYHMSPRIGSYELYDTLRKGKGYWIYFNKDTAFELPGSTFTTYTDTLYPGWNMVGGLSVEVSSDCFDTLDAVIPPVYHYDPTSSAYEEAGLLLPGKGYWVFSTDTTEFIVRHSN